MVPRRRHSDAQAQYGEIIFEQADYKIIIFYSASSCHFSSGISWFHRSKDFEAIKAGKSAIRPWLVCQYNKNTFMDLPSSVVTSVNAHDFTVWQ